MPCHALNSGKMKKNEPKAKKEIYLKEPKLPALSDDFKYFPFLNHTIAAIIVAITAFVFYITSVNGEYALDDGIIIHQNDHVVKGIHGVKDILLKDAYESFYRRMCATDQLAGGRYRPLSAVSFAIEQEFLGPYRTGLYTKAEDSNKNGQLDPGPDELRRVGALFDLHELAIEDAANAHQRPKLEDYGESFFIVLRTAA